MRLEMLNNKAGAIIESGTNQARQMFSIKSPLKRMMVCLLAASMLCGLMTGTVEAGSNPDLPPTNARDYGVMPSREPAPVGIIPYRGVSDALNEETSTDGRDKQEEREVNQRFGEFLAGEGQYSDQELGNILFQPDAGGTADLGYLGAYGNECLVQAVLLFHKNLNGDEFFAIGVKNKAGERKITIAAWPLGDFFDISPQVHIGKSRGSGSKSVQFYSGDELGAFFSEDYGRIYRYQFFFQMEGMAAPLTQNGLMTKLFESVYSPGISANRNFLSDIYIPMEKREMGDTGRKMLGLLQEGKLAEVKSLEEFLNAAAYEKDMPVVFGISYQEAH